MSKIVSLMAHFKFHLVFLLSLSFVIAETRRVHRKAVFGPESVVFPRHDRREIPHVDTDSAVPVETPVLPENGFPDEFLQAISYLDDTELFNEFFGKKLSISDDERFWGQSNIEEDGERKEDAPFGDQDNMEEDGERFVSRPSIPSCKPLPTCVPVKTSKSSLILDPPCLIVPRCGVCCRLGRKCLPVATETFTYSIQEIEYTQADAKMVKGRLNVTEEHHLDCICKCDVKQEDCRTRDQIYDNTKCRCVCQNELQNKFQCSQRGRLWNSDSCTCDCPVVMCCENGYFFNYEKCQCDF